MICWRVCSPLVIVHLSKRDHSVSSQYTPVWRKCKWHIPETLSVTGERKPPIFRAVSHLNIVRSRSRDFGNQFGCQGTSAEPTCRSIHSRAKATSSTCNLSLPERQNKV